RVPATVLYKESTALAGVIDSNSETPGFGVCYCFVQPMWVGTKTMTNPQPGQAARRAQQQKAAGGLYATEVNAGRSGTKWNPVRIVGLLFCKGRGIPEVKP
ncbi:MAG: hypothetical protein H7Y27_14590, partial [Gemmatimonadaceae bacterium]|nr:hypothetical protein [Chitinophagaceae bacterium]